jgi:DNA polymerase (family 10)
MVRVAQEHGFRYIAITDHSGHLMQRIAGGPTRLDKQVTQITALQEDYPTIEIVHGAEVDIGVDGGLDMPNDALQRIDLCIASVHSAYDLPLAKQTARIIKALSDPRVRILGHPLGRYRGSRGPMQYDFERVVEAAVAHDVALEINGKPERMDLPPEHVKRAARAGAQFVVSADAHATGDHANISRAVQIARAGGLSPSAVVNTRSVHDVVEWMPSGKVS